MNPIIWDMSVLPSETEADRRVRRKYLELEVQRLDGEVDVAKLSDAELYGIRDRARRELRGLARARSHGL